MTESLSHGLLPDYICSSLLSLIHHNICNLPDLIDEVYSTLKSQFFTGDKIVHEDRIYVIPSRSELENFVISNTQKKSCSKTPLWIVSDSLVSKYNLKNKIVPMFVKCHNRSPRKSISSPVKNTSNNNTNIVTRSNSSPSKQFQQNSVDADFSVDLSSTNSSSKPSTSLKRPSSNSQSIAKNKVTRTGQRSSTLRQRSLFASDTKTPHKSECKRPPTKASSTVLNGNTRHLPESAARTQSNDCGRNSDSGACSPDLQVLTTHHSPATRARKSAQLSGSTHTARARDGASKLKQTSLLEMDKMNAAANSSSSAKQKSGVTPKQKSGFTPTAPASSLPQCVHRLLEVCEAGRRVHRGQPVVVECARALSRAQLMLVPHTAARAVIEQRWRHEAAQRKMSSMSEEQRERHMRQLRHQERVNLRKKCEDQTLKSLALPRASPVTLPPCLTADSFGDLCFVSEFLHAFESMLRVQQPPGGSGAATTTTCWLLCVIDGVCAARDTSAYAKFVNVLVALVRCLLMDEVCQTYRELGIKLSSIGVTQHTVAELIRLILRPVDDAETSRATETASSAASASVLENSDEQISHDTEWRLHTCDIWQLAPQQRLELARVLVQRVLSTYTVAQHISAAEDTLHVLAGRRLQVYKARKWRRHSCQVSAAVTAPSPPASSASCGSRTLRRRLSAEDRQILHNQDSERKRRECYERDVFRDYERALDTFQCTLRRVPLGVDRGHRRYWLLPSAPVSLYVESGWAGAVEEAQQRVRAQKSADQTVTFPKCGQNTWFHYDTLEKVDELLTSLASKGIRESHLRDSLYEHYDELKQRFSKQVDCVDMFHSQQQQLHSSHQPVNMVSTLNEAIAALEQQLYDGALCSQARDAWVEMEPLYAAQSEQLSAEVAAQLQRHLVVAGAHVLALSDRVLARARCLPLYTTSTVSTTSTAATPGGHCKCCLGAWVCALGTCTSVSRMHVLIHLLHLSIDWSMSIAAKKCCVCRHRGDTSIAVVCTRCTYLYHWHCVRPRITEQPDANTWLCRQCGGCQRTRQPRRTASPAQEASSSRSATARLTASRRPSYVTACGVGGANSSSSTRDSSRLRRSLRHSTVSCYGSHFTVSSPSPSSASSSSCSLESGHSSDDFEWRMSSPARRKCIRMKACFSADNLSSDVQHSNTEQCENTEHSDITERIENDHIKRSRDVCVLCHVTAVRRYELTQCAVCRSVFHRRCADTAGSENTSCCTPDCADQYRRDCTRRSRAERVLSRSTRSRTQIIESG